MEKEGGGLVLSSVIFLFYGIVLSPRCYTGRVLFKKYSTSITPCFFNLIRSVDIQLV
jgi:hypothetical protein